MKFVVSLVVLSMALATPAFAQRSDQCVPRVELIEQMKEFDGQAVVVAQLNQFILLEIFSNGLNWSAYYSNAEGISCLMATGVGEVMVKPYSCEHPIACPNV